MANKRDYYEVLGVAKSATLDEIKKAYRKKAMENHPDRNPGDKAAEERFKEATEAYEVLSDEKKKAAYDQFGFSGVDQMGGAGGYANAQRDFGDIFGGAFGDILSQMFGGRGGGFGDMFTGGGYSSMFGGGTSGARSRRGDDLEINVRLGMLDAIKGKNLDITYTHLVPCSACSGSGIGQGGKRIKCPSCGGRGRIVRTQGYFQMQTTCPTCGGTGESIDKPCPTCSGTGVEKKREVYRLDTPEGVEDGDTIKIPGRGNAGTGGAPAGDLYVNFRVDPDRRFTRDGSDLYGQIDISFVQAFLGSTVTIELIDGEKINLEIPKLTSPGDLLRVKGRGVKRAGKLIRGQGDLYIKVNVAAPAKLTRRAEELLKSLGEEVEPHTSPTVKPMPEKAKGTKSTDYY